MKSKLTVKNFGPITDATLNLRNVNVLIGPQASGKSTLAKLYTICKSPVMYHNLDGGKFSSGLNQLRGPDEILRSLSVSDVSMEKFKSSLQHFSIGDFYTTRTEIEFDSPTHKVVIKRGKIEFVDKIDTSLILEFYRKKNIEGLKTEFNKLRNKLDTFDLAFVYNIYRNTSVERYVNDDAAGWKEFLEFYNKKKNDVYDISMLDAISIMNLLSMCKSDISNNNALYIPAERAIINLLKQASFTFQKAKVPLPGHLLEYASIYENATHKVKEFDLGFLKADTKFKSVNGVDKIYFSSRKSIKLSESASGFQSVVPMILPIYNEKNKKAFKEHYSFVIEEPETNLFPKAQYELLKFLEKDRSDDFDKIDQGIIHTYTTHSPFILSSLNNMLYAFKKGNGAAIKVKVDIGKILDEANWINPDHFSAYQIIDGKAKSIMDRKSGLIKENVIDIVSEDIVEDFRKIALASL
jgi:predicted ATPase